MSFMVELDHLQRMREIVETAQKDLAKAREAKELATSKTAIKKATNDVEFYEYYLGYKSKVLTDLEAREAKAQEMAENGADVVLVYAPIDDYNGFASRKEATFDLQNNYESAKRAYENLKSVRGARVEAWLEIYPAGQFSRIKELKAKIKEMQEELDRLERGE